MTLYYTVEKFDTIDGETIETRILVPIYKGIVYERGILRNLNRDFSKEDIEAGLGYSLLDSDYTKEEFYNNIKEVENV